MVGWFANCMASTPSKDAKQDRMLGEAVHALMDDILEFPAISGVSVAEASLEITISDATGNTRAGDWKITVEKIST